MMPVLALAAVGCATATQSRIRDSPSLPWTKPGFVQEDYSRDRSSCLQEAKAMHQGGCDHHFLWLRCNPMSAPALFKACMEAKGYSIVE